MDNDNILIGYIENENIKSYEKNNLKDKANSAVIPPCFENKIDELIHEDKFDNTIDYNKNNTIKQIFEERNEFSKEDNSDFASEKV